jgi:putative tricarboxylic transport membrane protein
MLSWQRHGAIVMTWGVLMAASAGTAAADWAPHRPLELVIPSGPGGGLDLVGRTVQGIVAKDTLSSEPVTVLNRAGGGGTVAIAFMDSHPRDGHYVSVQALPLITNQITGISKMGLQDVTPLALLLTEQVIFSVAADSPIKNGQDLIKQLRQDPASVSIAVSSSPGGQSHIAMALVAKAAGVDPKKLKIVFFDSGGEAVTALMGKHVNLTVTPSGTVLGPSEAGKIRMIALSADSRQPGALANVPTWKEQGVDAEFTTWRVLVGPRNMTAAEVAWWDQLLGKVTASPDWPAAVKRNLWTADYKNSAQTRAFLDSEKTRLGSLLGELGLAK